jgi:hypothetical protein
MTIDELMQFANDYRDAYFDEMGDGGTYTDMEHRKVCEKALRAAIQAAIDEAVATERERIATECWERRGHFASDTAARAFAEIIRKGPTP